MTNYLNPNWLLSRLLERLGVKTYLARTEFAAHFFAGCTFTLLAVILGGWLGNSIVIGWTVWTIIDEFVVDGYKGKEQGYDTLVDLFSKLIVPIIYLGVLCLV